MLSSELESCLNTAFREAREARHQYLTAEHLLRAILPTPQVIEILKACGADLEELTRELKEHIDQSIPRLAADEQTEVQPTLGFQRVLQRAVFHVQSSGGHEQVGVAHVLLAMFSEKQTHAVYLLNRQHVVRLDVANYLNHGLAPVRVATAFDSSSPKVVIFYSHADQQCLDRLLVHLKPLHGSMTVFLRKQIEKGLDEAAIAILLVSADFLASDFMVDNELPPLLMSAKARGVRILPVILKPCGFHRDEVLSSFPCANDPAIPLLSLDHIGQEATYNRIADEVAEELRQRSARGG